jgi:large subunit ribosomal protein L23
MIPNLEIIRRKFITERSEADSEDLDKKKVYYFQVLKSANKLEIRAAFEEAFKLKGKIDSVRTLIRPGKPKWRRTKGSRPGRSPEIKKAIITLKKGHSIADY